MNFHEREAFLTMTGLFLCGMLFVSILLAAFTGESPMLRIHWNWTDLLIGVGAGLGLVPVFSLATSVRDQAEEILGPSLARCHWYDFVPLAILVGILEEVLFRGILEPWAAHWDPMLAFILVNVVFGLMHSVSVAYAVLATILGMLLSLLAHHPGEFNLLRPIAAHAVYDYVGFLWIAQRYRARELVEEQSEEEVHGS